MFLAVLYILWTIIPLEITECSEVIDELGQSGLYISDYCPKIGSCPEGSHVMCMFYNPNSVMGPQCSNPQNISITPDIAHKMLDIVNAVRSKVARGKETGKDRITLPKGYGIFRLKWDSELATFAQVLANRCIMSHDLCRASKKFSDPGQTVGLVRFTIPHWRPVTASVKFNDTGLTLPKVDYAVTHSLKSWYSQKDAVTLEMIQNYPDWTQYPSNLRHARLYLEMIHGSTTHMGCGISAYSEYAYYDNRATMTFNSIQTICNFSSRPRSGKAVYQTTPPTEPGYTTRCGCPEGSQEDDDCLCSEIPSPFEMCGKKSCSPNVVLLPIFTVEDVPHSMLLDEQSPESSIAIPNSYRRNNSASLDEQENVIDDVFGPYESYGNSVDRTTKSPVLGHMMNYVQPQHTSRGVKVISDPHYQSPYSRISNKRTLFNIINNDDMRKRQSRSRINKMRSPDSSIAIPNLDRRNNSASLAAQENFIDDIFGPFESYGNSVDRTTRSPFLSPMMNYVQPQHKNNGVKVISEPHYQSPYLRTSEKKTFFNDINNDNMRKRESPSRINKMRLTTNRQHLKDVKNRYFSKKISGTSQRRPQTQSLQKGYSHVQNRKPTHRMGPSIFARSSTFRLPSDTATNSFSFRSDIKRVVAPRKDFTKGKQVLSTYLTKMRNHENISNKALNFVMTPNVKNYENITPRYKIFETTENYYKPSTNLNRYLKNKFHYQDFNFTHHQRNDIEITNSNEEADMKLMTLLDTLEQEVKHIALIGTKKELFDAKIRKIYDTVLNKQDESNLKSPLHTRTELDQEDTGYNKYVKYETDVKNHLAENHKVDRSKDIMEKRIYKSETKVNEINAKISDRFSDPKSLFLKKTKAHNSPMPDDENDKTLVRHFTEPVTHDIYNKETEDRSYPNNINGNDMLDKSMIKYSDANKNTIYDEDPKIKDYRDTGHESDLRTRENNLRNADKKHDYDEYIFNNGNSFNQNGIKSRHEDKNDDYRDTEKLYDEDVKNRPPFRQPLDIELKNRDVDKTIDDYRRTKKRSSDDNIKNKNQLRQFVGDVSLKSRNVYINNEGQSRHNYDNELIKRHNYDENLFELRRNQNGMRRDRANEFRSRVNGMRSSQSNKDYGYKEQELSDGDSLGLERRKFYQNKIDNLEKKLNSRNYRRRSEHDKERILRLDRPHQDELHMRPSSKSQHQFYIPDRARILHGF